MKLRHLMCAAAAGVALNLPAAAQEIESFEKLDAIPPEVLFKGIIREDDVTLLFEHVRESMAAAARGEEPKAPAALNRRAEQIQREVAARGSALVGVLLSAFESAARQMIREALNDLSSRSSAPPSSPFPRSSPNN